MAAYVTAAEVKTYLGISSTTDDTLITTLITRAQAAVDAYTHRTFSSTANATRRFTVNRDSYQRMLWLDEDLISINAVVTNADSTATSTVSSTEYITHPRNRTPYYAIEIRSDANEAWEYAAAAEMGITVSGKWAYSTTPPNDVKHATIRLSAFYYRQKDAQVFDVTAMPETGTMTVPIGMPRDVTLILEPYVRSTLSLGLSV